MPNNGREHDPDDVDNFFSEFGDPSMNPDDAPSKAASTRMVNMINQNGMAVTIISL